MKRILLFILLMAGLSAYAQKDNRIVIGTADTVYSKILNEKRIVLVHVPAGDKKQHYPVLYILDGETHFQSAVAIDEQLSGVLPDMIVVGINNTERERDLTPTHVNNIKESGGGESFMSFIEKELIPYIDSHYLTSSYRVFSGHSLGGLTVVNAFINHTGLFNAYIAIDPSLWWDDQNWIKKIENELPRYDFSNRSLFVGIANNIPAGLDTVSVLKSNDPISGVTRAVIPFVHSLRDQKPKGLRWGSKFFPAERHGTVELVGEYDALRYLFDYYQFRTSQFIDHPELNEDSVLAAHYKIVSERLGYTVKPSENMVNELAYDCMGRNKMTEAYKLFKRNTDNHPDSANAYDSLGDYFVAANDKQKAIQAFTKSLSLHETGDTRKKLNELIGKK